MLQNVLKTFGSPKYLFCTKRVLQWLIQRLIGSVSVSAENWDTQLSHAALLRGRKGPISSSRLSASPYLFLCSLLASEISTKLNCKESYKSLSLKLFGLWFRFLQERARKETKSFMEFYKDYSFFLKEGIVTSSEKNEKEEIAKLLRSL